MRVAVAGPAAWVEGLVGEVLFTPVVAAGFVLVTVFEIVAREGNVGVMVGVGSISAEHAVARSKTRSPVAIG